MWLTGTNRNAGLLFTAHPALIKWLQEDWETGKSVVHRGYRGLPRTQQDRSQCQRTNQKRVYMSRDRNCPMGEEFPAVQSKNHIMYRRARALNQSKDRTSTTWWQLTNKIEGRRYGITRIKGYKKLPPRPRHGFCPKILWWSDGLYNQATCC